MDKNKETNPFDSINKAAQQQLEAAKLLAESLGTFEESVNEIISQSPIEHQAEIQSKVTQAKRLLNEVKKGGNILDIVEKLNKLK